MRSSIQPFRRNSGMQRRTEDLVLYLKYENNFDDSSYYNQQVITHNPNVVSTSTKKIEQPTFDEDIHNNYGPYDPGGRVSALFGLQKTNTLPINLSLDTSLGRLYESNGKTYDGKTAFVYDDTVDPIWEKVVFLLQGKNYYPANTETTSPIYQNIAHTHATPHATLKQIETERLPDVQSAESKFNANSFHWKEADTSLKYTNKINTSEFDFSSSAEDFTIEFWCKPSEITTSDRTPKTTKNALGKEIDRVIFSTQCITIGFDYQYGIVVSLPNADMGDTTKSTSGTLPHILLTSIDIARTSIPYETVASAAGHAGKGSVPYSSIVDLWTHVAFSKRKDKAVLYVNGVYCSTSDIISEGLWSGKISTAGRGNTESMALGADLWNTVEDSVDTDYLGYLDDVRITKGAARYGREPLYSYTAVPNADEDRDVLRMAFDSPNPPYSGADSSPLFPTIYPSSNKVFAHPLLNVGTTVLFETLTDSSSKARTITKMPGIYNQTARWNTASPPNNGYQGNVLKRIFAWPGGPNPNPNFVTDSFGGGNLLPGNRGGSCLWLYGRASSPSNDATNHDCPVVGVNKTDANPSNSGYDHLSPDWDWDDEEWSIDLWISPYNMQNDGKNKIILSKFQDIPYGIGINDELNVGEWILYHRNGRLCFYYRNAEQIVSSISLTSGVWHHVAIQGNKSPHYPHSAVLEGKPVVQMFIDGTLVGTGKEYKATKIIDGVEVPLNPARDKNNVILGYYGLKTDCDRRASWAMSSTGECWSTLIRTQSKNTVSYNGYMDELRITKGTKRFADGPSLPPTVPYGDKSVKEGNSLFCELTETDKYQLKKIDPGPNGYFKNFGNYVCNLFSYSTRIQDYDFPYALDKAKGGFDKYERREARAGMGTPGRWSAKTNFLRAYVNNDFIIYGIRSGGHSYHASIRILTFFKDAMDNHEVNSCGTPSSRIYDLMQGSSEESLYINQLAFDGQYYYVFFGTGGRGKRPDMNGYDADVYLGIWEPKKSIDTGVQPRFILSHVSTTTIEKKWAKTGAAAGYTALDFLCRYNNVSNLDYENHQTLAIKKGEKTYLYTWCRVVDGNGAFNYARKSAAVKNTYPHVEQGSWHLQKYTIVNGVPISVDHQGTDPVKVYKSREVDLASWEGALSYVFKSDSDEAIFVLDYGDSSISPPSTSPLDYKQTLTVLTVDPHGDLKISDSIDVTQHGLNRATMRHTFCHKGHVYVGGEDETYGTDIYKIYRFNNTSRLQIVSKGRENRFAVNYAAGDYLIGTQCPYPTRLGLDCNDSTQSCVPVGGECNNWIRGAMGGSTHYKISENNQAILVSGEDVYSNDNGEDVAQNFNMGPYEDFTIEGAVKLNAIPGGSDDNPGMTFFDFGNTKLSNTSGFWTMHGPERTSSDGTEYTDYFDPNHIDPKSNAYLPNRFIHFAVQRRSNELELWLDTIDDDGNKSFALVAEDKSAVGVTSGVTGSPYHSVRAIGSTISGTNFFTGHMDNFKVWREALYGPEDVDINEYPWADGIFTSRDSNPYTFYYYYYKHLRRSSRSYGTMATPGWTNPANPTQAIRMYEYRSFRMWCTWQTAIDPRYSLHKPLPVEVHWFKSPSPVSNGGFGFTAPPYLAVGNLQYIGSSSSGRPFITPDGHMINGQGKGEYAIQRTRSTDSGYYYAVVAMGDPNKPKYKWQYTTIRRVLLMVSPWPEPPPPPKESFQLMVCNSAGSKNLYNANPPEQFTDGVPDTHLHLSAMYGLYGTSQVKLGDTAEMIASLYPKGKGWAGIYTPGEICVNGPYTFKWKNKGRGDISNRSRSFMVGLRSQVWPTTSLKFKDIRKGIKGPICVEAFDSTGKSLGEVCCPGYTLRLPDLEPIYCQIPSFYMSANDWTQLDYQSTWTYRTGQWQRNVAIHRTYVYDLEAVFGISAADLSVAPLAYDVNVPELLTGGIEYKWKIVGVYYAGTSQRFVVNTVMTTYDPNMPSAFYVLWEDFKGTITCEMQYVNYPADVWTNDPEGRPQLGRKTVVKWNVNFAECQEPWADSRPARQLHYRYQWNWWYWWYYGAYSMWNLISRQLGNGQEQDATNIVIKYNPCEEWVVPISYLADHGWRTQHEALVSSQYHRGITRSIDYDSGFWDEAKKQAAQYYYSNGYYAAMVPDWIIFKKTLYKGDNGKSTTIKLSNSCGERVFNISFQQNRLMTPYVHPKGTPQYNFFTREVIYYRWWWGYTKQTLPDGRVIWTRTLSSTETQRREQKWPGLLFTYGYIYYLGGCRACKISLDGKDVSGGWVNMSPSSGAMYLIVPMSIGTFYLYYGSQYRSYWRMWLANDNIPVGCSNLKVEFSTNPPDGSDWSKGDIIEWNAKICKSQLPAITSWGGGWGWWYWGCGWGWGYRYYRRCYWWHRPYTYYRPYGRRTWTRAYSVFRRPIATRGSGRVSYGGRGYGTRSTTSRPRIRGGRSGGY